MSRVRLLATGARLERLGRWIEAAGRRWVQVLDLRPGPPTRRGIVVVDAQTWRASDIAWAPQRRVVVCGVRDVHDAQEWIVPGTRAILADECGADGVRLALECCDQGSGLFMCGRWTSGLLGIAARGPASVTPRQREVLSLVAQGCSLEEISMHLSIRPESAKKAISRLLTRFAATNQRQLVARAIASGALPVGPGLGVSTHWGQER